MNLKQQTTTPYIIYAQIGFSTNRQAFNNNIASAEKSPIFKPHKSYKNSLWFIAEENFFKQETVRFLN
ncbi:MAG: hypothetical protein CVT95_12810 [Bacteroidetes bacterium HGW-Bacteroidetes-12]|nr:MAG: hypothetical protein CVT95_12810 [Bacteroidetes bacterium HGW-Bacteroidetes-12]